MTNEKWCTHYITIAKKNTRLKPESHSCIVIARKEDIISKYILFIDYRRKKGSWHSQHHHQIIISADFAFERVEFNSEHTCRPHF